MKLRVLIATHNRADMLADTLAAMTRVRRQGIDTEWVVVNNACNDHTDDVVRSFETRLPLRLLHEPRPGKNRALNLALERCAPCDAMIFTDDDVTPCGGWLMAIHDAVSRWPDHDAFGGRIVPLWPEGIKPEWIREPWLLSIGFAWHDMGPSETPYPTATYPFGPNFWVRGSVFRNGLRFQEAIGPAGNSRIMGSETSFLKELSQRGHPMMYCPAASVGHRVKPADCEPHVLARRMHSHGRGRARIHGVNYGNLLTDHPWRWQARQRAKLVIEHTHLMLATLLPATSARRSRMLWQHSKIGWLEESFAIAREQQCSDTPAIAENPRS